MKVDSIKNKLNTTLSQQEKIKTLNLLANIYLSTSPKKAIEYADKAFELAKKNKNKKQQANALNILGRAFLFQGNYKKTIECFQKSLRIYEKSGNKKGIADLLINIGNIYHDWDKYDKALEYNLKALKIKKELIDKQGIANSLHNIGNIYNSLKKYKKAINYYQKALKVQKEINDKQGVALSFLNTGKVYYALEKYDISLKYYQKALKINKSLDDKLGITMSMNAIGHIYKKWNNNKKALKYFEKSLKLAKSMDLKEKIMNNYKSISDIYSDMGKYQKAFECYKLYKELEGYVFNNKIHKQILEIQEKYETEKKQQKIILLTKQNKIKKIQIFGLIVLILFIITITFLIIIQNKLRSKQKTIELEQKLLRSQMNPHFIFNSMTAIQNFIYKNNTAEAGKYLSDFAKLIRLILENSREEYISIDKEIKTLEYYLKLQSLRFENKFNYNINIDQNIDTETMTIPPMLTQPFIENSIEHGIFPKNEKGLINICFVLKNNIILFQVKDNGIGREKAEKIKNKNHKSLATSITKERLINLNKKNKQKIKLNITDIKNTDGNIQGTKVMFYIPFKYI